ncbi:MAG: N-6 DNA methylase [Terriglobia bacterium]|jgi:type I restriction-modification system DNA methylase subunit
MEPLWDRKVTRQSIEACLDRLMRKYQDLPEAGREKLSEQDVRDYFITPLLEALGWGAVDPRERVAEKHLPRKGFSDYELCLPIGHDPHDPYLPLLYVEAKRFGGLSLLQEDLFGYARRSEADNQAIAYADEYNPKRGEKIGWAILTNFEIFRLWDTRRGVLVESTDWAGALKTDRTLEILYFLSRDQVAQDPRLVALSSLRKLPDIDEKFLSKLNEWRESLAGAIWKQKSNRAKLGTSLAEQQANLRDVVQRTLDRLIVIRTAEDRGLLPASYRLQDMVRNFGGADAVPLMLLKNIQNNTFKYFDHQYNSKLFGAHLADQMEVHNLPLSLIIDEMCKAGFSSMNADILGATYEQYLGQTVEIDPKEDAPKLVANLETRHAQGSYYTPRYIVQYIVDHTLGCYLYGTENGHANGSYLPGERRKTINEIQDLSVLDPACGSGSFLIYAFDALLTFYLAERERLKAEIQSRIEVAVKSGIPRLAAEATHDPQILGLKAQLELTRFAHARIIERHLYGVDLDPQAAEVASMNLLLKALTRNERLPRILGDNIKIGNSLVSGVAPAAELQAHAAGLAQLVDIRAEIHRATLAASENGADRDAHEKRIEELEQRFHSVARAISHSLNNLLRRTEDSGWFDDPETRSPFNWQVEFPEVFSARDRESRGFACIVGNPPYIRIQELKDKQPEVLTYFNENYRAATGNYDIYVLFDERGLALLGRSPHARLGFIQPHKFFQSEYGKGIRQQFAEERCVSEIVNFGDYQVFPHGTTYTCLLFLAKAPHESVAYLEAQDGVIDTVPGADPKKAESIPQDRLSSAPWPLSVRPTGSPRTEWGALEKMERTGATLRSIARHVFVGVQTSADAIYILRKLGSSKDRVQVHSRATGTDYSLEAEIVKPIISGADVERYGTPRPQNVLIFPYDIDRRKKRASLIPAAMMEKRFPETWAYLNENRAALEGREGGKMAGEQWYAYVYPKNLAKQHLSKICVPRLVDRLSAIWDERGEFVLDNVDVGGIALREEKCSPLYVVALLNSAAAHFYLRARSTTFRGGFLSANRQFLGKIPVPLPENLDPSQRESVNSIEVIAGKLILLNQSCFKIASSFESNLLSTLPVTAGRYVNFNIDYYSVPPYWKSRRLIPANGLELTDPVVAMRIENDTLGRDQGFSATSRLIISYQSEKRGPWKPLMEIEPANEDLRLFILLAARRFLAEKARKKVWKLPGAKASRRTVDVVLGSLVLPVWSLPHGSGDRAETNLRKISELMAALRKDVQGEINPSVLEAQRDSLDQEIDEIVFDLYELTSDQRRLITETVRRSR